VVEDFESNATPLLHGNYNYVMLEYLDSYLERSIFLVAYYPIRSDEVSSSSFFFFFLPWYLIAIHGCKPCCNFAYFLNNLLLLVNFCSDLPFA
jgi:hypothetical protein